MTFPKDYPNNPPTLKITSEFWHPNGACAAAALRRPTELTRAPTPRAVYEDGTVCISILHSPGEDQYGATASLHAPPHPHRVRHAGSMRPALTPPRGPPRAGYESASERWLPIHTVRASAARDLQCPSVHVAPNARSARSESRTLRGHADRFSA